MSLGLLRLVVSPDYILRDKVASFCWSYIDKTVNRISIEPVHETKQLLLADHAGFMLLACKCIVERLRQILRGDQSNPPISRNAIASTAKTVYEAAMVVKKHPLVKPLFEDGKPSSFDQAV